MYKVNETTLTPYSCHCILSILDKNNIDTTWIRRIWNLQGINNKWCMQRCLELVERYDIPIPQDLYGIIDTRQEDIDKRVSSYYNTPTNTGLKIF